MDVYRVHSTSGTVSVEKLRMAFTSHGLPEMIVSNDGAGFTSEEFGNFMAKNGILHVKIAP